MEVRIELEVTLDELRIHGTKTTKEFYEKYHNCDGVMFDDKWGSIYYDVELPYMPIEGQRLGTRWGLCIVTWACWGLEKEGESYCDKTRVIVREE